MDTNTLSILGTIKIAWYLWAIALFEYLNIPQMQVLILSSLMMIDFITGIWKQYRVDPRQITSHGAWVGMMKKVYALITVLAIALVFKGIGLDGSWWVKWILSVFIMSEWYSIVQNTYAVRTGIVLPEYDAISLVLKTFNDYMRYMIEKVIKTLARSNKSNEKDSEK